MIPIPDDKFFVNKFVDVKLPTKKQIFARTGQLSNSGSYSGDDAVHVSTSKTEQAQSFIKAAEAYDPPKEEVPESNGTD